MSLAAELMSMATDAAKRQRQTVMQDLLTPTELIELAATSESEAVRRASAYALYVQGRAHALSDIGGVA